MKNIRRRRTKEEIEELINKAALELIESGGFSNLTVRNIAELAKIEPIVFYNRYQNIEEFIDEFVRKYDYWLADVVKTYEKLTEKDEYNYVLKSLFTSLKNNAVMQELLRWELFQENDTTSRTAKLREFHTLPFADKYINYFGDVPFEIEVISAIIISGIYYLILHGRLTPFARVDINTTKGQKQIFRAIDYIVNSLFNDTSNADSKALEIAKAMKINGLDNNLIEECTHIPISIIEKL